MAGKKRRPKPRFRETLFQILVGRLLEPATWPRLGAIATGATWAYDPSDPDLWWAAFLICMSGSAVVALALSIIKDFRKSR